MCILRFYRATALPQVYTTLPQPKTPYGKPSTILTLLTPSDPFDRVDIPEEKMRYMVAILQNSDKHDAMGRSRRVTRMLNYSETRAYTHNTTEVSEMGRDKGLTQNTSQWGWRLYEVMKRW